MNQKKKKKKNGLTLREKEIQRRRKWWEQHKKEENTKRREKWKLIKDEENRKRREEYSQLDLGVVNEERRKKYWGGEVPVLQKKKSLAMTTKTTTTTTIKRIYYGLRGKRPPKILPSQELLSQIWDYIKNAKIPNHPNNKRKYYKCVFRLCWKSGLRISEAINFSWDLQHPEHKNLYLLRGKGNKDRWVCASEEVITELKEWGWEVNKITRQCYSRFLRLVKKKLHLTENIQLEPHSLRRAFATYNAINGMPLPILQQLLGHSQVSTTAIYVKDAELASLAKYQPI